MKIDFRFWHWTISALVTLAAGATAAVGQQPLSGVELAQPVATSSAAEAAADAAAELPAPTLAAPPRASEPAPEDDVVIELVKERYPSGAVKIEREMTQDEEGNYLLHGAWRQYDEHGSLIVDGRYLHNQREGLWRKFYRGTETELLATPPYNEFTPPFISTATFHAGKLHGQWTITDVHERKVHEIEFLGGQRHGQATWYHPSGAIMLQARYEDGLVTGDVVQYAADSTVMATEAYQGGRKLAAKVEYYDPEREIKKQEVTWLHATLVVRTPDDWDAGTLALFQTRGQDERHGAFMTWHSSGQPAKQGEFRHNLPVGKITWWYASGQKQMEGMYQGGRQEGIWTWWHENGQKAITGEYHDANPTGIWSWWTAEGKLARKADLSPDRPLHAATSPSTSDRREARLQPSEPVSSLR